MHSVGSAISAQYQKLKEAKGKESIDSWDYDKCPDAEFAHYLKDVLAVDFREDNWTSTAEDIEQAADRIINLSNQISLIKLALKAK